MQSHRVIPLHITVQEKIIYAWKRLWANVFLDEETTGRVPAMEHWRDYFAAPSLFECLMLIQLSAHSSKLPRSAEERLDWLTGWCHFVEQVKSNQEFRRDPPLRRELNLNILFVSEKLARYVPESIKDLRCWADLVDGKLKR